jgi:hypothetical protein
MERDRFQNCSDLCSNTETKQGDKIMQNLAFPLKKNYDIMAFVMLLELLL